MNQQVCPYLLSLLDPPWLPWQHLTSAVTMLTLLDADVPLPLSARILHVNN